MKKILSALLITSAFFSHAQTVNKVIDPVWRSFMVIKKALPDMFRYVDNPRIPKTTNGLESFFGHLKGNLNIHRGLFHAHRKEFILWYLFLKNKQNGDRFS